MTIKTILCPIDFSEFSRHAFDRAVAIARGAGASVTAVHVVAMQAHPIPPFLETNAFMLPPTDHDQLSAELKRFLALEEPVGVPVDVVVVDAPTVHHEILAQANRLAADLIVIGTHGRTGFQRLLLGSIAEKVLRTARQPVLTVGVVPDVLPTGASFRQILCAMDFSDCSMAALRYAGSLAEQMQAELTVLHVVERVPLGYDPLLGPTADLAGYWAAAESVASTKLHRVVIGTLPTASSIEALVLSGKPHHEILQIARERRCDLIVLGIHGRNAVDRLLFGSTAEPIVRHSPCAVLTIREDRHAAVAAA